MCRVLFLAPRQTKHMAAQKCSFISKSHRRRQNASSRDAMNCSRSRFGGQIDLRARNELEISH